MTIIVLAAGRGTRFDSGGTTLKLLARLPDGRPVIRAVAEACAALPEKTLIICDPAHQARISHALCGLPVQTLACPNADAGMGATLKYGVARTQPSIGWIVMLGDMPYVQTSTIQAVADALNGGALLARPYLDGQPGHPVALSRQLKDELLKLPDGEGAASLFRKYADQVQRIPSNDEGCVLDIDRPEDLDRPV